MIRRWSIWDEIRRMQNDMDLLFDNFFSQPSRARLTGPETTEIATSNYRQAIADVWETDKEVVATVELPGVDKKDIKINATDDGVEIRVEKKEERKEEDKKRGMYRLERSYSGFYRYIPTPEGIDPNKINASYKNGVLEIKMPKVESKKKTKQIEVK